MDEGRRRTRGKQIKFAAGITVVITVLAWLAYGGIQESKTYYVTVGELQASHDAYQRRYRVAGSVVPGSIHRVGSQVQFQIEDAGKKLPIIYIGAEALPDTLRDSSQAVADGRYQRDGTFQAQMVQAKCASKYEPAKSQLESRAR